MTSWDRTGMAVAVGLPALVALWACLWPVAAPRRKHGRRRRR